MNQSGAGLNDIEGIIPYTVPWWQYALIAAGVVLALAAAYALWRWWQRRKDQNPAPVDPFAHWHALSRQVQALETDALLASGQAKELYFQFSLLLRTAVEYATGARATDMTFREVQPLIKNKLALKSGEPERMLAFLEVSDLVKFADRPATAAEAAQMKQDLLAWVVALKPRAEIPMPAAHIKSAPVGPRAGGRA